MIDELEYIVTSDEVRIGNYFAIVGEKEGVDVVHMVIDFNNDLSKISVASDCCGGSTHYAQGSVTLRELSISEKWLIGFGFKEIRRRSISRFRLYFEQLNSDLIYKTRNLTITQNLQDVWLDGKFLCKIDYVHQLQNLYFVLSRKDLKHANQ